MLALLASRPTFELMKQYRQVTHLRAHVYFQVPDVQRRKDLCGFWAVSLPYLVLSRPNVRCHLTHTIKTKPGQTDVGENVLSTKLLLNTNIKLFLIKLL